MRLKSTLTRGPEICRVHCINSTFIRSLARVEQLAELSVVPPQPYSLSLPSRSFVPSGGQISSFASLSEPFFLLFLKCLPCHKFSLSKPTHVFDASLFVFSEPLENGANTAGARAMLESAAP